MNSLKTTDSFYYLTRQELTTDSVVLYREDNEYDDIVIKSHKHFIKYPISLEAYRKVPGGLRYLEKNYPEYALAICYHDIATEGIFSARPYQLGQLTDASTFFIILALLYDCCVKKNYDVVTLQELVYRRFEDIYSLNEFQSIASFAEWQGVIYSEQWNYTELDQLIKNLKENKLIRLADAINYMLVDA